MKRNQAQQHIGFQMNKLADGTDDIGLSGIVVSIEKDGGGENPGAGGVSENSNGGYKYLFTQAETDCYQMSIQFSHPTAITQLLDIYTDDYLHSEVGKIIKSGEIVNVAQQSVISETEVTVATTRV